MQCTHPCDLFRATEARDPGRIRNRQRARALPPWRRWLGMQPSTLNRRVWKIGCRYGGSLDFR